MIFAFKKKDTISRILWILALLIMFLGNSFAQIPQGLRRGIEADSATVQKALEMKRQGWTYIMPAPKSAQAAWGNRDGRTTWWAGYWKNNKTNETSSSEPILDNGRYRGDNNGVRYWRKGGTPPPPTKIEWLLSTSGGIPPKN